MSRVLLVSMPFSSTERPSLGLGLLKAGLERAGVGVDVRYLNLDFARHVGMDRYEMVVRLGFQFMAGEWVFAEDVFGDGIPDLDAYFDDVVDAGADNLARPFASRDDARVMRASVGSCLDECAASISWNDYALVGFTTQFEQTLPSVALARRVKAMHPDLTIAFGGANCEGVMGEALLRAFDCIDLVFSGEADHTLPVVARAVLAGEAPPVLDGVYCRRNGELALPPESVAPVEDMDSLPYPDYEDFFEQRAQLSRATQAADCASWLPFESSRGCWWGARSHCTFCGLNGGTMAYRSKSPDRVIEELTFLSKRYASRRFVAVDNILDFHYLSTVLPRLTKELPGTALWYEVKNTFRRDQVQALAESGIIAIESGIESFSSPLLKLMRKGESSLQNIQLLRWCKEFMVQPFWTMMAGFPDEDPAWFRRQAEILPLLSHLEPPMRFSTVCLARFSPLFNDAQEMGLTNVRPLAGYRYAFAVSDQDLFDLAYHFEYEYADGRNVWDYVEDLAQQCANWLEDGSYELTSLPMEEHLFIRDTRPVAVRPEHHLTGLHRAVYEYCDTARTVAAVEKHCTDGARRNGDHTGHGGQSVAEVLDELAADRLMLHEDGRYLSLAVNGAYQPKLSTLLLTKLMPEPLLVRAE